MCGKNFWGQGIEKTTSNQIFPKASEIDANKES